MLREHLLACKSTVTGECMFTQTHIIKDSQVEWEGPVYIKHIAGLNFWEFFAFFVKRNSGSLIQRYESDLMRSYISPTLMDNGGWFVCIS